MSEAFFSIIIYPKSGMSIKEQAITGVIWNSAGRFFVLFFEFIIGVGLARILSPDEFGLVGMVTIFLILSETLINSGFSQALIRKPVCTEEDFSTAFTFNFYTSVVFMFILFFIAPSISAFYRKDSLTMIIQVLSIGLFVNAFGFVQRTRFTRNLDFKSLNQISVFSTLGSGTLAILMAFNGFGVWSLVGKSLVRDLISTVLLWFKSAWFPTFEFYKSSFKDLFEFGSKLVLSGVFGIFTNNVVYIILGKYFSVADVGFYNRAELFKNLPSQNIESIVTSVAYPVLAKVQDDKEMFYQYFRKTLLMNFFVISILMCGLFGVAESFISLLLGEEWKTAATYMMYLCPAGIMYPLWSMNLNVFNIVGKAGKYLRLQLIMQLFTLFSVLLAIVLSVKWMIIFLGITSLLSFLIFAYYAGLYTGYTLKKQILDITPLLLISISMGIFVYFMDIYSNLSVLMTFTIQLFAGIIFTAVVSEIFNPAPYMQLKEIFVHNILKKTGL